MKRADGSAAAPVAAAATHEGFPDGLPVRHLNPAEVHAHVYVYAGGLAAALGHDLKIAAREPQCRVALDHEVPVALEIEVDARHVVVDCARLNDRDHREALAPKQRAEINACIQGPVLDADNHPRLRFMSGRLQVQRDSLDLVGRLTVRGHTHALHLRLVRIGDRYTGHTAFHLPHFGIEPPGRWLGLARIKPDAVLELTLPLDMGEREFAAGVKPV